MKKFWLLIIFLSAVSICSAQPAGGLESDELSASEPSGIKSGMKRGMELKEGFRGEGKFVFVNGREGGPDKVYFQDSVNRMELALSPCINEIINMDGLEVKTFEVKGIRIWNGSVWDLQVDSYEEKKAGTSAGAASESKRIPEKPSAGKKEKNKKSKK